MPFSGADTVTSAFGTAAPLASVTVPVIEAVSCATTNGERQKAERRIVNHARRFFMGFTPSTNSGHAAFSSRRLYTRTNPPNCDQFGTLYLQRVFYVKGFIKTYE